MLPARHLPHCATRRNNFHSQRISLSTDHNWGTDMPYTRPIRRFYLTPPSTPIFVVSVVLALLAVVATYGHISIFKASYAFVVLLIAYLVLLAGTLFRGV